MKHTDVWQPYAPTIEEPWTLARVAHLHRRAGFGATWSELQRDLRDGPGPSIDRFLHPGDPDPDLEARSRSLRDNAESDLRCLQAWWLHRMLFGSQPLREKLTLFWHDHFATSVRKVQSLRSMAGQNDLLRRNALNRAGDLLREIGSDPAMLIWLDGGQSRIEHPNENYAREFLELFTLGVGNYTERDVREAARAFTGWKPDPSGAPAFRFEPGRFDADEKTFFGSVGRFDAGDIVRLTLDRPEAARFLCRKLYRFFISETAPATEESIESLAAAMRDCDYSIEQVVATILLSKLFFSPIAIRQRFLCPTEWTIGMLRALELAPRQLRMLALAETCERQGQSLFQPPSVDGWAWGPAWLGSAAILERTNFAARILWGSAERALPEFDPTPWVQAKGASAEELRSTLFQLTLQDDVSEDLRRQLETEPADANGWRRSLHLLFSSAAAQMG